MTQGPFTLILCEGYHDRSFLAGALLGSLGWQDPGDAGGTRIPVRDLWGQVAGGDFGFTHSTCNAALRLRPCHGHSKVPGVARQILDGRGTRHFDRLIFNYDGDKGGDGVEFEENIHRSVENLLKAARVSPVRDGHGCWKIDGGAREVRAIIWSAADKPTPGVPAQQCLERLICAAAAEVWPERTTSLGTWLSGRPDPTYEISTHASSGTIPKSHSWVLMGGWFAEHGCDEFFRAVWSRPAMVKALQTRIAANGSWDHIASCSGPVHTPAQAPAVP